MCDHHNQNQTTNLYHYQNRYRFTTVRSIPVDCASASSLPPASHTTASDLLVVVHRLLRVVRVRVRVLHRRYRRRLVCRWRVVHRSGRLDRPLSESVQHITCRAVSGCGLSAAE